MSRRGRPRGLTKSPVTRRILRGLKNADATFQGIADAVGVTRQRVQQIAVAAQRMGLDIPERRRGRRSVASRRQEAIEQVRQGCSIDEVASALQLPQRWLVEACRSVGLDVGLAFGLSNSDLALRRRKMASQVRAGKRPHEVARAFGVHPTTVRKACREAGIPAYPHGRPNQRDRDRKILRALARGKSVPQVAASFGVPVETVRRVELAAERAASTKRDWSLESRARRLAAAVTRVGNGEDPTKVAANLGWSESYLRRACKAADVPLPRKRRGRKRRSDDGQISRTIADRVASGEGPVAVARDLGIHRETVRLACRAHGVQRRERTAPAVVDRILVALQEGSLPQSAIAEENGVSKFVVARLNKKLKAGAGNGRPR